ncbi:MAG TPA: hypothetical protein VE732_02175 [Nitrososphaera sp.]|jgi:hypothetical protein|nr:hypothetical protein [Nitrososphaera sp.]
MISFFLGVVASLIAAVLYDQVKKRSLKAKQQRFIRELNKAMAKYIEVPPENEDEVAVRRREMKSTVQQLSNEIFGKDFLPIESLRLETTEYPPIDCKWCHRTHKAHRGSRGDCQTCSLPLDVWIGCQNNPVASEAAPNNSFNRSAS